MTGDHFIKNDAVDTDDEEEDVNFPVNTVAVVLYDRATRWIAVYPKAAKSTVFTIEGYATFCWPHGQNLQFLLRQRA